MLILGSIERAFGLALGELAQLKLDFYPGLATSERSVEESVSKKGFGAAAFNCSSKALHRVQCFPIAYNDRDSSYGKL